MSILTKEINTLPRVAIRQFMRTYSFLIAHGDNLSRFYVAFVLITLFVNMAAMPIHFTDTDMWYHLNGGRYFWENFSVPDSSFFSFIEPTREWTNYFWGFQAITYGIHHLFGWTGLIFLKAILVTATAFFISRILISGNRGQYASAVQLAIFSLVMLALFARFSAVRPHLFSYLFIPIFIYILYFRPKHVPILPLLTVIWINVHGVEWIVGALVCTPFILSRASSIYREKDRKAVYEVAWVAACLPAMLLNPFGLEMLLAPLKTPSEAYNFIRELQQPGFSFYTTLTAQNMLIRPHGASSLLFLFSLISIIALWARGRLKLEHVVFAIGGTVLLFRGLRFLWEWILLSIPLFQSASHLFNQPTFGQRKILGPIISLIIIFATPVHLALNFNVLGYPYNTQNLPVGTTKFIRQSGIQGSYALPPAFGGFVQWELYPKILIHSDMEFPPFDGEIFYELKNSFSSVTGLKHLMMTYKPDFIAVNSGRSDFEKNAKSTGLLTPVFFDNELVLYANTEKHPALVKQYALKYINPHNTTSHIHPKNRGNAVEELKKVLTIDPTSEPALTAIAKLLIELKQLDDAKMYTTRLRVNHPNNPNSYLFAGLIETQLDNCNEAIQYFRKTLDYGDEQTRNNAHKNMANCHYLSQDFASAYQHFQMGFNQYKHNEDMEHFYQFAFSSVIVGESEKARVLLKQMLTNKDNNNAEIFENAAKLLDRIESGEFTNRLF
jgi:Tfp pilus assembly protein PilF